MLLGLLFALCSVGTLSIIDTFQKYGLHYEKIGEARLIDGQRMCKSRKFDMLPYVNTLTLPEGAVDADIVIQKAHLQQMFHDVCRSFNMTAENATPQNESSLINASPSGYLERLQLHWNVEKFGNDLTAFFLYNKINSPFYGLIDKEWLDVDSDIEKFVDTTAVFPERCESAHLVVLAQVCNIQPEREGDLYAIFHAGQLMEKSNAFVVYDVPKYVLISGEEVTPVEFESCKALNGSSFVCMETTKCKCDVSTMTSCDIYGEYAGSDFSLVRKYGTGTIVATNLPEVTIANSTVRAVSPVFTFHTSYGVEESSAGRPQLRYSVKTTPVITQAFLPELSESAKESVGSAPGPIRLYRVNRKGVPMLSNQPGKASVWDDVRDFFLHLI